MLRKIGSALIIIFLVTQIDSFSEAYIKNFSKSVQINPENSDRSRLLKEKYSVKELQEDFLQFRRHIEETFPCPYEFTSKESFDRSFQAQYKKINKPMSLRDFYQLLAPLKGKIGCGHAHLDYPEEYRRLVQTHKFPLILSFLENRCYVRSNLHESSSLPLYSEILSINELGIESIMDTLRSEISADGNNRFFKFINLCTVYQFLCKMCGVICNPSGENDAI